MGEIPPIILIAIGLCFLHQAVTKEVISETVVKTEIKDLSDRLPDHVRPIHYDIFLQPFFGERIFDGNVTILFNVSKPTSTIILHTKDLKFFYTKLYSAETKAPIPILRSYEVKEQEYWITELSDTIAVGLYEISLGFVSTDNWFKEKGFYQSQFFNPSAGRNIDIAVAELEPAEARSVFPCFDEPAMKATFKLTVQYSHDYGRYAISNMDIEKVERYANYSVTTFKKSVKMSTYLVTVVVTNFPSTTVEIDPQGIGSPFELIVYGNVHFQEGREIAAKIGKESLEYLIDYFKVPYPLPKVGMIGISRARRNSLECWGLIIFGQYTVFYNEELKIVKEIAHELSHFWFGDLVTMKWWNDIWLNEGFATFMALKVMQGIRPDVDVDKLFWEPTIDSSLVKDTLLSAKPIVKNDVTTKDIMGAFDDATYSKGASFLRMLESFIGADKLRQALSSYLERFAFGSAETSDVVEEIKKVVPEFDIGTFFETWTEKPGYPVINVEKLGNGAYKLTQRRYLGNLDSEKDSSTWLVPIIYVTDKDKDPKLFIFPANTKQSELVVPNSNWVKLNWKRSGYFRVNYSRELWYELSQISSDDITALSENDRSNLFSDALIFSDNQGLEYDIVLELLKSFKSEKSKHMWEKAFMSMRDALKTLDDSEINALKKFARSLVDSRVEQDPSIFDKIDEERYSFHRFACYVDHQLCAAMVKTTLDQIIVERKDPFMNIPGDILTTGGRGFSVEFWLQLLDMRDSYYESEYHNVLGATNNSTQLQFWLEKFMTSDRFYEEYFTKLITSAAETNFTVIWDYIQNNWEKIVELKGMKLDSVLEVIVEFIRTDQQLAEAKALREKYVSNCDEDEKCVLFDNMETILNNRKKRREEIRNFLKNNSLL